MLAAFVALVGCGAAFVWLTGQSLSGRVAVHFGASGMADGFMPRIVYLRGMLVFAAGLPLLLGLAMHHALGRPDVRIGLPRADYWLAPQRRPATVRWLRRFFAAFESLLVVFLCYVHGLVVLANQVQPPQLAMPAFYGGLGVLAAALLVATVVFVRYFRLGS
ncbi:MAG: hypothetical protein V4505_12870 [Pseudomonadota bacterium]